MEPLIVRVRKLREDAKIFSANNSYSAAPLIERLAELLEESIQPDDFDRGFAAGHEAGYEEALGCPD